MGLLTEHSGSGVPLPYLLARIAGRRACLVTEWPQVLASADPLATLPPSPYRLSPEGGAEAGLRNGLQREFAWLHRQMGRGMQRIFEPFFLPLELRTLFMALRLRSRGEEAYTPTGILRFSLLGSPVKKLLLEGGDLPTILAGVGANADFWLGAERALPEIFQQHGLAECEGRLVDASLEHAARGRLHPAMALFVTRLIDMENIVAFTKQLRWRMSEHTFIEGGSFSGTLLRRAARDPGVGMARRIIGHIPGIEAESDLSGLLPLLVTRLGRVLRRQGREPGGVGMILDYLWRRLTETRNLSLLLHGANLDRELLEREMVL